MAIHKKDGISYYLLNDKTAEDADAAINHLWSQKRNHEAFNILLRRLNALDRVVFESEVDDAIKKEKERMIAAGNPVAIWA